MQREKEKAIRERNSKEKEKEKVIKETEILEGRQRLHSSTCILQLRIHPLYTDMFKIITNGSWNFLEMDKFESKSAFLLLVILLLRYLLFVVLCWLMISSCSGHNLASMLAFGPAEWGATVVILQRKL